METMGAKLVAAVILLGVPAIASVGAWLALRWGRGHRSGRGLTALNCLAGGVFLGTCFLHLAVEGRERWANYLLDSGRSVDFPIFEAIMVSGLFVVLLLDSTASFAARKFALWSIGHRRELVVVVSSQVTSSQDGGHCGRLNAGFLPDKSDGKDVNCSARETSSYGPAPRVGEGASKADGSDSDRQQEQESMSEPVDGVTHQLLGNLSDKEVLGSSRDDASECRLLMEYCSECAYERCENTSKSSAVLEEWYFTPENLDDSEQSNSERTAVEMDKANAALLQGHLSDSGSVAHRPLHAKNVDSVSLKDILLSDSHPGQSSNHIALLCSHDGETPAESTTGMMKPFQQGVSQEGRQRKSSHGSPGSSCVVPQHVTRKCDHCGRVCLAKTKRREGNVDSCDTTSTGGEDSSSSTASPTTDAHQDPNASKQVKTTALPSTLPQKEETKLISKLGAPCVASSPCEQKSHSRPSGSGDKPCGASCRLVVGGKECKDHWDSPAPGSMGLVVLVMALAFHTVFDGLAVGLQSSVSAVWQTTGVISLHRGVVTFCLALQLLPALQPRAALPLLGLSALAAPLGLLLGLVVTTASDVSGVGGNALACSALQGLAAGTFLYVTFFEILKDELVREGHPVKVVLVMAGFAVSAGLKCIDV